MGYATQRDQAMPLKLLAPYDRTVADLPKKEAISTAALNLAGKKIREIEFYRSSLRHSTRQKSVLTMGKRNGAV